MAAICAATLIGCGQPNVYQPPPPPTVTVSRPVRQTVTNYLEETGTTEAVERVEVRARVTGFLEEIRFEPGKLVEEGEILYVIEQRPFLAKVDAAKAELAAMQAALDKAENEYKQEQSLLAKNATSERELVAAKARRDSASAAIDAAKAALDQAQLDLEYTEVETPISGRVGKTLVKRGNLVDGNAATHLTTVIKYDPIYANFNISERDLLELRERAPRRDRGEIDEKEKEEIEFYLQRASDQGFPFKGHFDYADLAVDQSTGTFMIRGVFPNPNYDVVPGLFVRVRVPVGVQEKALLVPERAVGADQAGKFVLIVNSQNTVERRDVTLGTKVKDMVVIDQGLQSDESVVIEGVQRARPGAEVQPQQTELSAPEEEPATERSVAPPPPPDSSDDASGQTEAREDGPAEAENSTRAGDQANS